MSSSDELQQRITELEAENARLKRAAPNRPVEYSAVEDIVEGFPGLRFSGPDRKKDFFLGQNKLRIVKACWHRVEEFLRKHEGSRHQSQRSSQIGEIDQI
jgi:hypothetical protein